MYEPVDLFCAFVTGIAATGMMVCAYEKDGVRVALCGLIGCIIAAMIFV